MKKNDLIKLKQLAIKIDYALKEIFALIEKCDLESQSNNLLKDRAAFKESSTKEIISNLKEIGRNSAEENLKELKQTILSDIYSCLGGSSIDKKKPKKWLIERIMWELYDFREGHEIIKKR